MKLVTTITAADAPQAIGAYSHATRVGQLVFISGQIPLNPETMMLVEGNVESQIHQVFKNLLAVIAAVDGKVENIAKLTIYLTDLKHFAKVNEIMENYFSAPYPARVTIGVHELPKNAQIEIEAILAV